MAKKLTIYKPQNCGTSEVEITDEDREYLRRNTYHGQCMQFREACIDLFWQVAKMLRLREICDWLERVLRRFKKRDGDCECGVLSSRYLVEEVSHPFLLEFMGKINAEEMKIGSLTFARGQLLLFHSTVDQPPDDSWVVVPTEVVLTFKIHSDKWTASPKVLVPRWWGGYKFAFPKDSPMLEHIQMTDLTEYLAKLHKKNNESVKSADRR